MTEHLDASACSLSVPVSLGGNHEIGVTCRLDVPALHLRAPSSGSKIIVGADVAPTGG